MHKNVCMMMLGTLYARIPTFPPIHHANEARVHLVCMTDMFEQTCSIIEALSRDALERLMSCNGGIACQFEADGFLVTLSGCDIYTPEAEEAAKKDRGKPVENVMIGLRS